MTYTREILNAIGIEPERVGMVNLSSAMGGRFAELATEMAERIKKLGPNPMRSTNAPCNP
jgi:F420-non-reducing hydrogenase iron-sulfur subunit